jgi:hypothetical protein
MRTSRLLQDLGILSGLKATSDLLQWLKALERRILREFLELAPDVQKMKRYEVQIDKRVVGFKAAITMLKSKANFPIRLAKYLGLLKIEIYRATPAHWGIVKI